jgi:O-antigen ligase
MTTATRRLYAGTGLHGPSWVAVLAATALLGGATLAAYPWLTAGVVVGALLMAALFFRPFVVVAILLALGPVDLSFVTGGFKGLFVQLGGFDMNGIRLIGVVSGFALLLVVDREMARHAFAPYGRWYVLFLFWAAATLTYSMAPLDGLRFLFKLAFPLIIFIAVLTFARTRQDVARLGDVVLIGAAVITLLVNPIYVLAGGYIVDSAGYIRAWGVGAHQNPFSFYLITMILFAYSRFAVRGELRYLGLCGILAVWVVLTVSRTALLGVTAGLLGMAVYNALIARNYRAVAISFGIGLVVVLPLLPFVLERTFGHTPGMGELVMLAREPWELYRAVSWQGREIIWPIVYQAFLQNPWIGLGLGSQMAVVAAAIPPEWGAIVHNEYLRLLTDVGIAGCAIYAVAVGAWFVAVVRAGATNTPLVREFAAPAVGALMTWGAVALTENAFDYYAPFTQFVAFYCAATLAAARAEARAESGDAAMTEAGGARGRYAA